MCPKTVKRMNKISDFLLQIGRIYIHEFTIVKKDAGLLLFFLFLPLAYPVIYSLIYNPELVRDVKMVVVDNDMTPRSRELIRKLDASQEIRVIGNAANITEAKHAMHSHNCYGILEIPNGFDRNIGRGDQAPIALYSEMSLLLRYKAFLVAATNISLEMGSEIQLQDLETMAPIAATLSGGDPMPIHNISMGNIENGFDSFIMPGVIVLILHQCLILVSGLAGGAKHEDRRLIGYNPINESKSVLATMLGQILCFLTVMIIPVIFLLHYVPLIFAFPVEGKLSDMLLFIFPMMLASLSLGYCLQVFVKQREQIFIIWVVTSVAFLFLSGLTWPFYDLPPFWKALSCLIPATWGVEGFIQIHTNGASLAQVRPLFINLWLLTALYFTLGYFVNRFVMRPRINSRLTLNN